MSAFQLPHLKLTLKQATLGPRHPYTLNSTGNLVDVLRMQGKLQEAREAMTLENEDAVIVTREILGPKHMMTLVMEARDARLRIAESISSVKGVVERMTSVLGEGHPQTKRYQHHLISMTDGPHSTG